MSDVDEEKGLLNMKRSKYFNKNKLGDIESFINRSYYLSVMLFLLLGLTMASTVLAGIYKESELTETILITVAGPIYLVLFLILLCCGRQTILRIALVLVVTAFVAFMSGFISGANLKIVAQTLKDN
tara:strand:+ start:886 stop:1266 length:381 start_codon:yes stop_codon:yes gene_type:complete